MTMELLNRKTVLDTIRTNAMLRVQDIYDAVERLPVTVVEREKDAEKKPYDILREEGGTDTP